MTALCSENITTSIAGLSICGVQLSRNKKSCVKHAASLHIITVSKY